MTTTNAKFAIQRRMYFVLVLLGFVACSRPGSKDSHHRENWNARTISQALPDSLNAGKTYLSVYAEIYSQTEHLTHKLTATVSMRNINIADTVYISRAEYYNTHGQIVRSYFDNPIFIAPLETVEIVINETDVEGGTGANFLFEWQVPEGAQEPFFESVMISTSGQQGLSFATQGRRIE